MSEQPAEQPRKIAFVFTSMPVGGAEDFALGVGPHLAPEFEAHYICLRDYGRLGEEARSSGRKVHLTRVFCSRWITPWAVRRFSEWLRSERISLVHSQTHHAHVFATKAAKRLGIPSVVHQQKTLEKAGRRRARIFQACLERASHVIALSERTASDLEKSFALAPQKVSVVPNGIERSVFRPVADRTLLRRQAGLPEGVLLAGCVGRLHQHKSHETTIEAIASAREQGVQIALVLVGEGAQKSELEILARRKGVADAVIFAGPQRPVVPWIQVLDLFVLPSIWEGQPLALLQAVACGIPVLASNIEGNTAVLPHDHPGLFASRDAPWLAKLFIAASRDPGFLGRLLESQQCVDIPWSDQSAKQLAAIYRGLLE